MGYGFSPHNSVEQYPVDAVEREKIETRKAKKSRKTEMLQVELVAGTISEGGASSSCSGV